MEALDLRRPDLRCAPAGDLWVEVSVDRLRYRYNPFTVIGVPDDIRRYDGVEPAEYTAGNRSTAHSLGRVVYHMQHGWTDPITVDWSWSQGFPERLVLTDGHHRFCAAILLRDRRIVVSYSGPISEIDALR